MIKETYIFHLVDKIVKVHECQYLHCTKYFIETEAKLIQIEKEQFELLLRTNH